MYYILYRYKNDRSPYTLSKVVYDTKKWYDDDLAFVLDSPKYSVIKHGRTNEL